MTILCLVIGKFDGTTPTKIVTMKKAEILHYLPSIIRRVSCTCCFIVSTSKVSLCDMSADDDDNDVAALVCIESLARIL